MQLPRQCSDPPATAHQPRHRHTLHTHTHRSLPAGPVRWRWPTPAPAPGHRQRRRRQTPERWRWRRSASCCRCPAAQRDPGRARRGVEASRAGTGARKPAAAAAAAAAAVAAAGSGGEAPAATDASADACLSQGLSPGLSDCLQAGGQRGQGVRHDQTRREQRANKQAASGTAARPHSLQRWRHSGQRPAAGRPRRAQAAQVYSSGGSAELGGHTLGQAGRQAGKEFRWPGGCAHLGEGVCLRRQRRAADGSSTGC